ncbi:unnamed protein product [Paramecium sonneborni]|uniref:Uncharacterized protein n=1 Tax=Paramecium sonneborni TaxID=65129 RepID=A0A8S1RPH9_9CILI|nr:unnamed protein product [Paramecium sonneborni]
MFSQDGQKLTLCSKDKNIRVYHVKEKKQILKLEGHKDQVFQIIFTSNQLISCSQDKSIKLWDIIRGHEINNICLNSFARSIDISFNQSYLACGCYDGSIEIWDISDISNINKKLKMAGHTKIIASIVFSPKEDILVSGSYDQQIIIWNYHTGLQVKKMNSNQEIIQKIIFSPNGQYIIFICKDAFIRIWNTEMDGQIITLKGHQDVVFSLAFSKFAKIDQQDDGIQNQLKSNPFVQLIVNKKNILHILPMINQLLLLNHFVMKRGVTSVAFSPDGMRLASAIGFEKMIVIWKVKTLKKISSLDADQVYRFQFMPNGKQIVSGGYDNINQINHNGQTILSGILDQSIIFWNVDNEDKHQKQLESKVGVVLYANQGQQLAVGMVNKVIIIFDSITKQENKILQGQIGEILALAFCLNDLMLASAGASGIILWDILNEQIIQSLNGHSDLVWSVQFQPNQNIIAICSAEKTIRFWNLYSKENEELINLEQDGEVYSIALSPDGKILASGGEECNVKLWNTNRHSEYHTFFCSQSQRALVSLSGDEQSLAIQYIDGSVRIFNTSEGREIYKIFLQDAEALSLCISPDGIQLAAGLRDKCIRIWNTKDKTYTDIVDNMLDVSSLAYSSDGLILAAGSHSLIILFNSSNLSEIRRFQGHTDYVVSLSFSYDNKQLLPNSKDNSLRIWSIQTGELKQLILTSLINVKLAFFKENNMDSIIVNNFEDQPREIILSTYEEIKEIRLTKKEMLLANLYNHPIVIKNGI